MDLIAGKLRVVHVVPGAQLLREGEHARSMFIVREGELQILKHGKGGAEYKLAVLKTGDCVGEMSLIDIQPRSATARAIGAATLYVLDLAEIGKLYTSRRRGVRAAGPQHLARDQPPPARRRRGAGQHGHDRRGDVERRGRHHHAPGDAGRDRLTDVRRACAAAPRPPSFTRPCRRTRR